MELLKFIKVSVTILVLFVPLSASSQNVSNYVTSYDQCIDTYIKKIGHMNNSVAYTCAEETSEVVKKGNYSSLN